MTSFDDLTQRLVESGLLDAEAVDAALSSWKEQAGTGEAAAPKDFVAWLVDNERITEFQADAIAAGHAGPFTLGPYEVHEHVAAGRMGGIFRAVHQEFNQPVCLKVFPSEAAADPELSARIGRELRVAIELDHPNVIRAYQLGKVGNTFFLAMEDLSGETLESRLERDGALPYKTACKIILDVANGLAHLHANDIIHRDLRPANIWISSSGIAKLMEFGAARDAYGFLDSVGGDMGITTTDTVLGEYDYMAPEQAKDARDADLRSDIYGLGCTLYHALTGRVPFEEKNPARLVLKHMSDPVQPPSSLVPDIPHQLSETIAAMMAKQPGDRYQKAEDVAYALDPFVEADVQAPPEVGPSVSDAYLSWVQSSQATSLPPMSEEAVAVTPELTNFLDWMAVKQAKKKKKKR